jgi:O-acetyl-ADP-ribose deacetylase (regulator of RNase III)
MENKINLLVKNVWDYLYATCDDFPLEKNTHKNDIYQYLITHTIDLPIEISTHWDQVLQSEINRYPIINFDQNLNQVIVHQGDITQLQTDAIVNAANTDGLGCFSYGHKCIDNVIHTKAGPRLRVACKQILNGKKIPTNHLISTPAFNLPSKYVFHVVGPIYDSKLHDHHCIQLSRCYINCLTEAKKLGLGSIAFCCVSTGVYGFPSDKASQIAKQTVKLWLEKSAYSIKVIFCTYKDEDYELYQK